ncbi:MULTISPECIES: S49 family peptidase [unclassified Thiocapsa]|uniref:S49 family peptidase n=1 Tax=unclassified Thiocapsa TaxID=2641286 RepID=UPI0035B15866
MLDALTDPWAIEPDALRPITDALERLATDPRATDQLQRRAALDRQPAPGVRIIPLYGPILRRNSFLSRLLGWPTVEALALEITAANDAPGVGRIVLDIDSPGGVVCGTAELAALIRQSRKPVVAYVEGMAASAAYWLASAADEIVCGRSALVGSIGVVATYRPDRNAPTKVISSQSPLKQATPETEHGRAEIQRTVDALAAVFLADVARYRATTPATVATNYGRGGLLVGSAIVKAGMADRAGTFASTLTSPRGSTMKPTDSAATRLEAVRARYQSEGMSRPEAVLRAAREHAELAAQAAADHAPPPLDNSVADAYRATIDTLVMHGEPRATAPLRLARENPELARRYGAYAARQRAEVATHG